MMRRVREQISTHEVVIELSDAAKELLVEKGYDPTMGARPLRRAIQRYIEDPLADFVLGSDLEPGVTIVVDRKDDDEEVSITLAGGCPSARRSRCRLRRTTSLKTSLQTSLPSKEGVARHRLRAWMSSATSPSSSRRSSGLTR